MREHTMIGILNWAPYLPARREEPTFFDWPKRYVEDAHGRIFQIDEPRLAPDRMSFFSFFLVFLWGQEYPDRSSRSCGISELTLVRWAANANYFLQIFSFVHFTLLNYKKLTSA